MKPEEVDGVGEIGDGGDAGGAVRLLPAKLKEKVRIFKY